MKKRTLKKVISLVVSLGMIFTTMYAPVGLAYADEPTTGEGSAKGITSQWTLLDDIEAAAASETPVAITMTKGDDTWILPTAAATSTGPKAETAVIEEKTLTANGGKEAYGWTITKTEDADTYTIVNLDEKSLYLYVTAANNGVRINSKPTVGLDWSVTDGYLTAADSNAVNRYLGVYITGPDWRCYALKDGAIASNIKDQELHFWAFDKQEGEEQPLTLGTIAEALAGDTNAEFMVKGVVTLVEGKNIYVQDETGGICLYFDAAPTDISLGDTIIGTGKRATYRGLPELTGGSYEKSEGMTLAAKDATIGALTTADVCTYVSLKGLTVTEVYDNNGSYSNPNITVKDAEDKTIQIYRAVVGKTDGAWDIKVGDTLDIKAAVGINNTTLQLRNTLASEITVKGAEPEPTYNTIAEALAGEADAEFTVKGVVTLVDGKNIYVQDETGGICLYFDAAPTDISLGDTVIGTGKRATYRGLPELSGATYEKSEGMTLAAKETTLGAITTADVCTYVTIKGLTVDSIEGNNTYVKDADGGRLSIFKAVLGDKTLAVGDKLDFTGAVGIYNTTLQLRNTKAEEITVENQGSPGTETGWTKLEEAPFDGAQVVIYYPAGSQVMTATASGAKLAGTAATVTDGKITVTDDMAKLDVIVDGDTYSFKNGDGNYLTSGATGNSLTFAEDATSDLAKWTLEQQADGTWYLMNVGAAYNGNHNQALEYYSGFTTYGVKTNNAAYKFEFYGIQGEEKLSKITTVPQDGANLVIYHPTSGTAMTATASGAKLAGTAATVTDGKITVTDDMAKLDVIVDGDTYSFKNADGKYLISGATGNSLTFAEDATSDLAKWTLEQQADGTWYLMNVGAAYNGNHNQALEYYSGFTTYGVKTNNAAYKFEFYGTTPEPSDPPAPAGDPYGLSSKLETGDEVILFNEEFGKAITSEVISNYYLKGADMTPEEGIITTNDATAVWKVTVNDDGTYTFTQGDLTLGGTQTTNSSGRIYNNIALSGARTNKWTLEKADNGSYMYLGELPSSKQGGHIYIDWYANYNEYSLVDYANPGTNAAFIFTFYKKGADPEIPVEDTGDLVTDLSQLKDGATVAIYSPGHKTAISSKPNGDWYLKANAATVEDGKVVNFTDDFVWSVKVNDNGTYSFYAYGDDTRSITVWPSGNYAELSLNVATYPDNTWTLTQAKTKNCFYANSPTVSGKNGPAYIEAYVRNEAEVFSGYFTSPTSNKFTESEFALQFYLVDPEEAIEAYDDGEWDGVLTAGEQYVFYNEAADASVGLYKEANYAFDAIPTEIKEDSNGKLAEPGNGAYVFTVESMGRYYAFKFGDKYFATNNSEELYLADPTAEGKAPEEAKWYLTPKSGNDAEGNPVSGYIIYNKTCTYNGTPVCMEYYSSVFSGWTYSTKNPLDIYLFNFYKVTDDTFVYGDVVQKPSVIFDCADVRYVEQDFEANFSLDDLDPEDPSIEATYTIGDKTELVPKIEFTGVSGTIYIPSEYLDGDEPIESFDISINVKNTYGLEYSATKTIKVLDEPFFGEISPAANSQTKEDLRPVISAEIGNVGENPTFTMTVNGQEVEATYENGVLTYKPEEDMAEGRTTVQITVTREDGVSAEKQWSFNVGFSAYQMYFGQLHSHTTYSDGSGSLDTALEYVAGLPESANVQFVAFTDHSNYFDTTSAANPADALNDASLMTPASKALWDEYKSKVAAFNNTHNDIVAIGGFEMTWSGGPGHINTFDSEGLVSRNDAALNNKTNDAGMKLYYETINKGKSLNQFNHPGNTFGNFTDFSYWDPETDDHMFLVEVGNGEGQIGAGGYYPSYEEYFLALDKGWHLAPTNNQDNHKGRWGNANDARDVVLADDFSEQGIYDAIRNMRVYATEDKNLHIGYTVNDEPMGTIFSEVPESLLVNVNAYDPDESDELAKVEIIVDGGKTIHTWDESYLLKEGTFATYLDPAYSYYLIRVTQKDGDIAVTAPVWTGMSTKVGITGLKAASEEVYKGEETKLVTSFFNNEEKDATVKSLTYTTNGGEVIGTDTKGYTLKANGTLETEYACTFDDAKITTVTVTAVIEYNGEEGTYTAKVELDVLDRETEGVVTPIADVIKASDPEDTGYRFTIEGTLTSNASGYDKDTAFFDCVYVQDDTAGICIFPVSGNYKEGDKVRVVGHTDFYQGEPELQVKTIEVIGSGSVEPKEVTAAQINDRSVEGSLITLKGTVESFEEANGLIQTIMVKDANGDVARVFIDGYITTGHEVENCEAGAEITVTGLASYDDTFNAPEGPFQRIRIRDRADIVCTKTTDPGTGGDTPGGDTPGGDTPGGDTPGGNTPGGDTPGGDQPGGDQPGGDQPGGDQPGGDQPGGDQPGDGEEPAVEHRHTYGPYVLTKKATPKESGLLTKTCTECGKTVTMEVNPVVARAAIKSKNTVKFVWKKVKGAQRYRVYFAKCEKTLKRIATTTKRSYLKKNLKKGQTYRFRIVAQRKINGKWTDISTSYIGHFATGNLTKDRKYTNTKRIYSKPIKISLKVGKKYTIKATATKEKATKKLLAKSHSAKFRYLSTNTAIAKVSSKGRITAKKKGTCYVYVVGVNGVWRKIKVTVK